MSWLYSRALVEEYSAATCSDGAQFAPLSGSHTPQAYLPSDRMTAFSRPSRFGMTFAPLTGNHGAELLTWFLEASRARTSALQDTEKVLTESAQACGEKWRELLVKFDHDSCSWKTHRSLWEEALSECWLTLPRWGSMQDGVLLERATPALHTRGSASGWWRTPTAAIQNPKSSVKKLAGRKPSDPQVGLADQIGGIPNPLWTEWLMGWPLGWTDLKPLETDRCHSAPLKRGGC
jgi:hypothetical protein